MSRLRFGLLTAGLLGVAGCLGADPSPVVPQPSGHQRIVFVGQRFDVGTVRSDGSGLEPFIGGGAGGSLATLASFRGQQAETVRYTWPVWSPDGERVALSRVPGLGEDSVAGLVVASADDSSAERQIHETRQGALSLIAPGAPHYAFWAPDSRLLSFVGPRAPGQGLGLFSADPDGGQPHEIAADAPLYHVWSPDGTLMLVHRRQQLLLYDSRDHSTRNLGADSFRYRAPAFSPDGERIAYVVDEGGTGKLVASRADRTDRVTLMEIPGEAAFAWSPAGGRIAVATRQLSRPLYSELYVVDEDGSRAPELLASGDTAAFYWSPDGSRLARVTYADDGLAWHTVSPAGETRFLTSFTPTTDFLTHLQFFDQFAPSHLVWSSDSTKLTFAGEIEGAAEGRSASQVWVVDAVGGDAPRPAAAGRLAFWIPSSVE